MARQFWNPLCDSLQQAYGIRSLEDQIFSGEIFMRLAVKEIITIYSSKWFSLLILFYFWLLYVDWYREPTSVQLLMQWFTVCIGYIQKLTTLRLLYWTSLWPIWCNMYLLPLPTHLSHFFSIEFFQFWGNWCDHHIAMIID